MNRTVSGLDWRTAAHWGDGRKQPCRYCRRPAFLIDANGIPAHKTCADDATTSTTTGTTAKPGSGTADTRDTGDDTSDDTGVHTTHERRAHMTQSPDDDTAPTDASDPQAVTLLDAALTAASRGWYVFPVVPNAKIPAVKDWQTRATVDPARIQRCWTPGPGNHARWNVGIACGRSGLVVVDLDVASPGDTVPLEYEQSPHIRSGVTVLADLEGAHSDLPDTYTVATPSGGEHRYFTASTDGERRIGNCKLGWKIDVRGRGGLVVAAGSTINGRRYNVIDPGTGQIHPPTHDGPSPAPLPGWVADLLNREPETDNLTSPDVAHGSSPDRPLPVGDDARRRYVAAAVRGELNRVLSPKNLAARRIGPDEKGPGRNTDLFQAACQLGQLVATGDLDRGVVFAALVATAQAIGLTRDEAEQTTASGLRKGATQPRPTHQAGPQTGPPTMPQNETDRRRAA